MLFRSDGKLPQRQSSDGIFNDTLLHCVRSRRHMQDGLLQFFPSWPLKNKSEASPGNSQDWQGHWGEVNPGMWWWRWWWWWWWWVFRSHVFWMFTSDFGKVKLTEKEKNQKLNDLLDALEFNQVSFGLWWWIFGKEVPQLIISWNCCGIRQEGVPPFPAHVSAQIYGMLPKQHNGVINTTPQNSSCRNFTRVSYPGIFCASSVSPMVLCSLLPLHYGMDRLSSPWSLCSVQWHWTSCWPYDSVGWKSNRRKNERYSMGSCCHGTPILTR